MTTPPSQYPTRQLPGQPTQVGAVHPGLDSALVTLVDREVVEEAISACEAGARRAGGRLPPFVLVYLLLMLWLFPQDDYEEVAQRLTGAWRTWTDRDPHWAPVSASAVSQARAKLPAAVMEQVFTAVAEPVAAPLAAHSWLTGADGRRSRMLAIDGFDLDLWDSPANAQAFGRCGTAARSDGSAGFPFPKARVVVVSEVGTHVPLHVAFGAITTGEQTLAAGLYPRLGASQVLLADRNFPSWTPLVAITAAGADVVWRARTAQHLPVVVDHDDGSYTSVIIDPDLRGRRRAAVMAAAHAGQRLDPALARWVRVVDYEVTNRGPGT